MSTPPPPFDRSDDADEQYRRASGHDPSRPSEATRRAVLEHAARLAAERSRRNARRRWLKELLTLKWRPAIVGTLAVAVLVSVVIAPQFLAPTAPRTSPPQSQRAPVVAPLQTAVVPANAPAAPRAPEEGAPAPRVVASTSPARPSVARERKQADANVASVPPPLERVVVTASRAQAPALAAYAQAGAAARPAPASPPAQADPEALRQAAAAGDLAALRAQLASGGDIDARDAQGRTALMLATVGGQADAVAVLLAHGADPSAADAQGTTPLRAAVAADERAIIAMLRRYGAR